MCPVLRLRKAQTGPVPFGAGWLRQQPWCVHRPYRQVAAPSTRLHQNLGRPWRQRMCLREYCGHWAYSMVTMTASPNSLCQTPCNNCTFKVGSCCRPTFWFGSILALSAFAIPFSECRSLKSGAHSSSTAHCIFCFVAVNQHVLNMMAPHILNLFGVLFRGQRPTGSRL